VWGLVECSQQCGRAGVALSRTGHWLWSVNSGGAPFFTYDLIHIGRDLQVKVGMSVPAELAGDDRVRAGVLPGERSAVLIHTGPYDGVVDACRRLLDWGAEQGLTAQPEPRQPATGGASNHGHPLVDVDTRAKSQRCLLLLEPVAQRGAGVGGLVQRGAGRSRPVDRPGGGSSAICRLPRPPTLSLASSTCAGSPPGR
jgi:hypothetical protein